MFRKKILVLALFSGILIFSGCKKNDSPTQPKLQNTTTFKVTIKNISKDYPFIESGVFNTPVGMSSPGPLMPGNSFEVEFQAAPGMKLSFATMFGISNDFFYATPENGIALFDNSGKQITGNVTSQISLWDAGTEMNQEPGLGSNQPPRQASPNTGPADPNNNVRPAPDTYNNLPKVSDVIKVTLSSTSSTGFKLTITNVSNSNTLKTSDGNSKAVPLSPGVFVIHSENSPLFINGKPDYGMGLESLAEDGNPSTLSASIKGMTGLTSPFAPGTFAVFNSSNPIFKEGQKDMGEGLEAAAEDGNPSSLENSLKAKTGITSGVFNMPSGSSQAGPILPGHSFQFTFEATKNDYLTFVSMLGQSNDIFAAPASSGIKLFDSQGNAISGDITSQIYLWDAGTEVNEFPGIGLNQAPRQSGPNTGSSENGTVKKVSDLNDGFTYPNVANVLKVTIEPQN